MDIESRFTGRILLDADLSDADLSDGVADPAQPEEIARIDKVREIVLANPKRLNMENWHSIEWNPSHTPEEEIGCGSAHCIAGWLQALSSDEKIRAMDALEAGVLLAPTQQHMFYTSDAVALEWLKGRLYAKEEMT